MIRPAARAIAAAASLATALAACDATLAFEGDDGANGDGALADGAAGCATAGCPLSSLHCDVTSGACVECVTKSDCTMYDDLPFCDPATHTCVDCLSALDCGPNATCVVSAKQCVERCSTLGLCGEGLCHKTSQTCVQCTRDADCKDDGKNQVCDLVTKQCVDCVSDAICPVDHPRCDPASQRCVECLHVSDCKDGEVCDPRRHLCVKP